VSKILVALWNVVRKKESLQVGILYIWNVIVGITYTADLLQPTITAPFRSWTVWGTCILVHQRQFPHITDASLREGYVQSATCFL